MRLRKTSACLALAALMALPLDAMAVAYCALRDPVGAMHELFPESTTFRSFVGTVGSNVRDVLRVELPFDFHFNEFGRHTLYVVFDDGTPIGVAHARSELGDWGLDEIVWALDLDLNVSGLRFQRTRNPSVAYLDTDSFRQQLIGLGVDELKDLLNADGSVNREKLKIDDSATGMARSTIHSAIKTILVTSSVWAEPLEEMRALALAKSAFPAVDSVERINIVYSDAVLSQLKLDHEIFDSSFATTSAAVYKATRGSAPPSGVIFKAIYASGSDPVEVWWAVDPEGRIRSFEANGVLPDVDVLAGISESDHSARDLENCATRNELALLEVLTIAGVHLEQ